MDEPISQQGQREEQTVVPAEVWERLDQFTRDRVIELFALSAYNFVTARYELAAKEDCDVYSRRDAEDYV